MGLSSTICGGGYTFPPCICCIISSEFQTPLSNSHLQASDPPIIRSPTSSPISITHAINMTQPSNTNAVVPSNKQVVREKVIIQCSRLKRESPLSSETDYEGKLRGASRIKSCLDSSTPKSPEAQARDRRLHEMSKGEVEKEIEGMDQWEADQLYYDWSTCCAIWYPSQNAMGESQWNHKTPYGEIEIEEEVQAPEEEYATPKEILARMKQKHTQQQAQFQISYPNKRINDRAKHHHDICSCKHKGSLGMEDEKNCAVRLTNIPSNKTKYDIFRIINSGPVVCLHYTRSPPRSSGGTCKVVFKTPESAANMIAESMKLGIFLGKNRIKVGYHTIGYPAWKPLPDQYPEGQPQTRVLCIKSTAKSAFKLDDLLDFFNQVCKPDLDFTTCSLDTIVFCFTSIEQARLCFRAAEQLPGYSKKFELFFGEDPFEYHE